VLTGSISLKARAASVKRRVRFGEDKTINEKKKELWD